MKKIFHITAGLIYLAAVLGWPVAAKAQLKMPAVIVEPPHKSGSLVRDGNTIYLLSKKQKRGFTSLNEFLTHNYRAARIMPANSGDKLLPEGQPMRAKPGSLVLDSSDGRTIYLISKTGEKQGLVTPEALKKYKKKTTKIWSIDLSKYPVGDPIQ
jgi:hypothetical protein